MTQPTSGLLPALIGYYHRLADDPDQQVADFGFSAEKIHFCLVLEPDGNRFEFQDIRERTDKGKPIPKTLLVPDSGGRSGTMFKPFFCWDNTGYALGRDNKDNPRRAAEMFAAFRELHLSFRDELAGDEGFTALCRFLERWEPDHAEELPDWKEAAGLNLVFRLRSRMGYVHESEAVKRAWSRRLSATGEDGPTMTGVSLVDGAEGELARLHPQLSGVTGANTSGAALVSFNLKAFESYGKSQSYNAPVGTRDAFRYGTALNRLLADRSRRIQIGDATVVFWSDRASAADAEEAFQAYFFEDVSLAESAEKAPTVDRVRSFLEAARQGRLADRIQDPEAPFYILGLSPNAARVNVRYWLTGTVQQFADRLARFAEDLQIGGSTDVQPLISIQAIIAETVRRGDKPSPQLAGSVARAVLEGLPSFPESLLSSIVRRIRIDGVVTRGRAAILKAILKREGRSDVDAYLNKEHPEKAYHCGRLLAVLAFAQEQALGEVNSGVVRRNLGSVMAMPGLMLGRLQRAAEAGHIPKLEGDLPDFLHDEIMSINIRLGDDVPSQLSLRQQTLFALGFYQQLHYLGFIGTQVKSRKRYRTSLGEWVRSKLEVKVADALNRFKLDYIYEPRALLEGGERWPDFVVRRGTGKDLFIEVLGMNTPEYNETWNIKLRAYEHFGITTEGGPKGRLIVLDFRDPKKYDERLVFEALREYLADPEETPSPETQETSND